MSPPVVPVKMQSFTLEFSCREVEKQYEEFRSHSLLNTDRFFLNVNLFLHTWFVVSLWRGIFFPYRSGANASTLVAVLALVVVLCQWLMMRICSEATWLTSRTRLLPVFRLLRLFVFSLGVSRWFPGGTGSVGMFLKGIVLGSGSLKPTWLALGMPLNFKHHIVVQVLSSIYIGTVTQAAVMKTAFKDGDGLVQAVWRFVDDLLLAMSGAPLNYQEPHHLPSKMALTQLLLFIHLINGLVLPSLVLWIMEHSSRKNFVNNILDHDELGRSDIECPVAPSPVQLTIFLLVAVCVMWSLLGDIAGRLHAHEL